MVKFTYCSWRGSEFSFNSDSLVTTTYFSSTGSNPLFCPPLAPALTVCVHTDRRVQGHIMEDKTRLLRIKVNVTVISYLTS